MRIKIYALALLAALLIVVLPFAPALAAIALDGTPVSYSSTTQGVSGTFTSTGTSDVILVWIRNGGAVANAPGGQSVTASGLTFAKYAGCTTPGTGFTSQLELWYAVTTSAFSGTISETLNTSSAYTNRIYIEAFSGVNTSSPFDPNGSLPGCATSGVTQVASEGVTVSTSNASDVLVGAYSLGGDTSPSSVTIPTGWTSANSANIFSGISYDIVSSTQTSITPTWVNNTTNATSGVLVAAIQAVGTGVTNSGFLMMGGTP